MKYKLKVYSIWEFGQRKDAEGNPHQEDSLYPPFGKATEADRTFILCDGMGGHDAGEVASATVCEAMSASIRDNGHDAEGVFTNEDLKAAIAAAFDALDRKDSGAEKKMGTTMTFLKFHNEGVTIAHMGDSRVYHIRPGKTGEETQILHETEDHSLVNDLVKIGELTREEARFSKQKNVITRAMQPNQERRPKADEYHTADIKPGDYFYMCSDGMLEQPEMENGQVLKNIFSAQGGTDERRIEILRGATEENRDNHTAFIIRVEDVTGSVFVAPPSDRTDGHMAVVEEDEDASVSAGEGSGNGQPVANGDKVPKTGWRKFLSVRNIAVGVAVIALGVFGAMYVKSCNAAPEEEKEEQPAQPARKPECDQIPVKPSKPSKLEPTATPQIPSAVPAAAPPKEEVGTSVSSIVGSILNGGSQDGVVVSEEQTAVDAVNNNKK